MNEDKRFGCEKSDCSTFIPRDFSASLLSLDNVNYAGLVAQAFSCMPMANPEVQCRVRSCGYQEENGACVTEQIEILPRGALASTETFCGTFTNEGMDNYK